jgi:lipopolysaccharide/colanic/teichoic acid biosynthesis glycosyltransferase
LRYIDNWSLWFDLQLIFRTLKVVFRREGSF